MVRALPDLATPLSNSDRWTLREAAVHLVNYCGIYAADSCVGIANQREQCV